MRLPLPLYKRLAAIAKREHRYMGAECNVAIEAHVERCDREHEVLLEQAGEAKS